MQRRHCLSGIVSAADDIVQKVSAKISNRTVRWQTGQSTYGLVNSPKCLI